MKNILILEDNKAHMNALIKIFSEIEDVKIFKAYNMTEACYMLSLDIYNLFLVDIILDTSKQGDVSGLNFVKMLRDNKRYQFTPVIFITSLEDPKLSAFKDLHCYDYIEKPFHENNVIKVVKDALEYPLIEKEEAVAYFRKEGVLYSVHTEKIKFIKIVRKGVTIFTTEDCLQLPYRTADQLLRELGNKNFIQCSRNTIFNKLYVESIDFVNRYIKLKGVREQLEIGVTMRKKVEEKIQI